MITIAHLLDDFSMGGVTRALTLFEEPMIARQARSKVVSVNQTAMIAPKVDADLIVDHAAVSWRRLGFLISLRARNPKARLVHVEHGYTQGFEAANVTAKRRFRAMLRTAFALFDDVLCVSNAQRNWLINEVGIEGRKLRVIYPWTDRSELFAIAPAQPRGERPLKLVAYGRYAEVKNFAELITAMRCFSPDEVQLTLFGDGPERTFLTALSADMPNVRVLGPCLDPKEHLADCDAVIVPSKYEAFGLVATEARMAARAVIGADVDGLPEQLGEGGHVASLGAAPDIAEAIRWAIRADLPQLGMAGRRSVKSQHSQILYRWSKLIEEVRQSQRRRPMAQDITELGKAAA